MKKSSLLLISLIMSSITSPMCSTYKILDLVTKDFTRAEAENINAHEELLNVNHNSNANNSQQDRRSFDDEVDNYCPCTFLLREGIRRFIEGIKNLYETAEVLNSALNDSKISEYQKKD